MKFKNIKYWAFTKSYGLYINLFSIMSPIKASNKAFELFSSPRKGKLSHDAIPNVLLDATLETINYNQNDYQAYIWQGNDEIILLVHGWESNTSRWKKLLPYLKKTKKTIVAIDAPAHGLSTGTEFTVTNYAKIIAEMVKKYNPRYIIAHSIGGLASIYYQYINQNPAINKMILLGSPSDFQVIANNYCNTLSLNNRVKIELEKRFAEKLTMTIDDFSGMKFGNKIKTATLVIHDNADTVVSINEGKKIASTLKNAQFLITDNLGHAMQNRKLYSKMVDYLLET